MCCLASHPLFAVDSSCLFFSKRIVDLSPFRGRHTCEATRGWRYEPVRVELLLEVPDSISGDSPMDEAQADTTTEGKLEALRRALPQQQPTLLALLALLAVLFFLAVTGLSRAYHAQRDSLGDRWFTRGVVDLSARHYDSAVMEFRSALLYSRDNYTYQLNLAEALIGLKRTAEASTYLVNLWERQPEDGLVNLELARIAVEKATDRAGASLLSQCDLCSVAA